MLIYEVLKQDHQVIRSLLAELLSLDGRSLHARGLIAEIRSELIPHARAEEAVFYNSLRSLKATEALVRHTYPEHVLAESLLRALQVEDRVGLEWRRTAERLRDALNEHITEEEEDIFPEAQLFFQSDEAAMMGEAFTQLKAEVKGENLVETTLELIANVMPPRLASTFRRYNLESRLQP